MHDAILFCDDWTDEQLKIPQPVVCWKAESRNFACI